MVPAKATTFSALHSNASLEKVARRDSPPLNVRRSAPSHGVPVFPGGVSFLMGGAQASRRKPSARVGPHRSVPRPCAPTGRRDADRCDRDGRVPQIHLRACLRNGWNGLPARSAGQPAQRNGERHPLLDQRLLRQLRTRPSTGLVARRHRPVACATQHRLFRRALSRSGYGWTVR